MKSIYRFIFLLLFAFNLNAQHTESTIKDSLKNKSIELFREVFWKNIPKPVSWTNDYEDLFTDTEQSKLDSIISTFEKQKRIEIAIVTIDTIKTSKDNFDDLSLHIAQTWGIGKKDQENGILIAISKGHRRIRIENSTGVETILSDAVTAEIIENYFIPAFKKGEYYNGTLNGLKQIIKFLNSKL